MNRSTVVIALAVANLVALASIAVRGLGLEAEPVPAVVRAQKIELVDTHGHVRASLEIAGDDEALLSTS